MKKAIKIIIVLITLGLLCSTASADTTYLNGTVKPNHIVIDGVTSGSGTIEIQSETSINVMVSGNHFEYTINDYKVPGTDDDDTLTIEVFPIDNAATLTVGKTILIWDVDIVNTTIPMTSGNGASYTSPNFTKTTRYISDKFFGIDIASHLSGKRINIKINGTSSADEVTINFIGKRTIVADGKFSTSIKTEGFPDGTYTITANNGDKIDINKTIVTLPYVAPTPKSSSGGGGGSGTGGTIKIIKSSTGETETDYGDGETAETNTPDDQTAETGDTITGDAQETSTEDDPENTFQTNEPSAKGLLAKLWASLKSKFGFT